MKSMTAFKRGVAKARRDWKQGHYDVALTEVNQLLADWPDNPQLLVMWADLVQLQQQMTGPTIEEAAAAYRRAADLEGDLPGALVELGHFLYSVHDDAKSASKAFDKAIIAGRRLLIEALLGKAKAMQEMGRVADARACLDEAYMLRLRDRNGADDSRTFAGIMEQLTEFLDAG
jgi:tetratricopeptide (TPR) repeat protein